MSVVERTLRQRSRRVKTARVALRVAAGGAVAAAAAALIVMSRGVDQPDRAAVAPGPPVATVAQGSAESTPPAGVAPTAKAPRALVVMPDGAPTWELSAGSRVSAGEGGPLRIASAEGTALTLDPQSILTVIDLGQVRRFALLRGAVHARVRKLGAGERFIIDTADAEVEVRGTAFRVEAAAPWPDCRTPSPPPRSGGRRQKPARFSARVVVEEGVVSVRSGAHEERLYPGDSWPAPCAGAPTSRPARGQVQAAGPEERSPSSSLAKQNDLFSAAVAARKAGNAIRALELWERLIREYPRSSLVEGAMAGRMRLLAATHPERATSAAGEYLARFPAGFARAEAVALLRAADGP